MTGLRSTVAYLSIVYRFLLWETEVKYSWNYEREIPPWTTPHQTKPRKWSAVGWNRGATSQRQEDLHEFSPNHGIVSLETYCEQVDLPYDLFCSSVQKKLAEKGGSRYQCVFAKCKKIFTTLELAKLHLKITGHKKLAMQRAREDETTDEDELTLQTELR